MKGLAYFVAILFILVPIILIALDIVFAVMKKKKFFFE